MCISQAILWGLRVDGDISARELAHLLEVSQRTIQRHLKDLQISGFVKRLKNNNYSLAKHDINN